MHVCMCTAYALHKYEVCTYIDSFHHLAMAKLIDDAKSVAEATAGVAMRHQRYNYVYFLRSIYRTSHHSIIIAVLPAEVSTGAIAL